CRSSASCATRSSTTSARARLRFVVSSLAAKLLVVVESNPPPRGREVERAMKLKSQIDSNSEAFKKNAAHHRGLAEQLRERTAEIAKGGPEESRKRHTKRNKLLPRERVERLLDPGAPFLEVGALAAYDL